MGQTQTNLCQVNQNLIFEPFPIIGISPGPIQTITFSNRNFLITSDLLVGGVNLHFINCKFKISAGRKINFNYGNGIFQACQFFTCGGVNWEGIEVIGEAKLSMYNCKIHYANTAIKADCGSTITLSSNEFYHNELGFDFSRISQQYPGSKINILRFFNNQFIGWLRNNNLNDKSYFGYGGRVDGITQLVKIGTPTSWLSVNVFKNLKGGLVLKNSNVNVNYCRFQEILSNGPATQDNSNGRGVMIINTNATPVKIDLSGGFTKSLNSYTDCEENFIYSSGNVNLTMTNTGLYYNIGDYGTRASNNQHNGIYIGNNKNSSINITNNKIDYAHNYTTLLWGNMIKIENCNTNIMSNISGNTLNDNTPLNEWPLEAALECLNVSQSFTEDFKIENNIINKKLYAGIKLENCRKIKVNNNNPITNVGLKSVASDFLGIHLKGGQENSVTNNVIIGQTELVETGNHSGLFIDASKSDYLCNNTLNLTANGIRARNLCNGASVISATTFGSHHYGLHYEPTTEHMQQIHKGNIWNGTCFKDARYLGNKVKPNQYLICDDRLSDCSMKGYGSSVYFPPIIEQNGDWIKPDDGYLQSCVGLSFQRWKPYFDFPQFPYSDGDGIIWSRDQSFLSDYNVHPDLANDSSTQNHYLALAAANDLNYFNVSLAIENIYNLNESQRQSINNLSQQLESITQQINVLYENYTATMDPENNTDFISALNMLLNNYDLAVQNLDQVYQGITTSVQSRINQAQGLNSNLQTNNSIQTDEKYVSQAVLDQLNGIVLSEVQRQQLVQIAQKCYRLTGDVVYKAFSLLDDSTRLAINASFPNECNQFDQAQGRNKFEFASKLTPNPTNGMINYQSNVELSQIEIYSLNGINILLKKGDLGKEGKINLENQPKGIYFARLISKDSDARIEKIILE